MINHLCKKVYSVAILHYFCEKEQKNMKQFFKYFFASSLAIIVTTTLFIGLIIGVGIIAASGTDKKPSLKENSVLEIDFDFNLSETSYTDFNPNTFSLMNAMGLDEFRAILKRAKDDSKIEGILLNLSMAPYSLATLKEAREALLDFKTSGKFIVAYSETLGQTGYYMATVADEIYLYPEANMEFLGLSSELMFFKSTLDKLDVDLQIIRGSNNKFKSAVEPFMLEKMSDANRQQIEKFLHSLWADMLADISKERNLTPAELNTIADSLWAVTPEGAKKHGLIDGTLYQDQLDSVLKEKTDVKDKNFNLISLKKYKRSDALKIKLTQSSGNIAVIYANGAIESGEGSPTTIGSKTLSKAIKDARENDKVKAIVLRINSPGGSALASDVIWRELELTKEEKPLIVSMGDLAASGGYYIACNAHKIYAQPTTLTGSIGVFGIIPNLENTFKEHLGITFDVAKTNHHAMISPFKPLTEEEKFKIQEEIDRIYDNFISKVAAGRNISKAKVDSIGQGRVWAGSDALHIGLVDELGSLNDAVKFAATKAEIVEDDIKIITYPKREINKLTEIIQTLEDMEGATTKQAKISDDIIKKVQELNNITSQDYIQARLPFEVKVK